MSSSTEAKPHPEAVPRAEAKPRPLAKPHPVAAPRLGLRLLFDIWRREWWNLLLLNLLFMAAALPVVTIGPALAALSRITLRMVQDRPIDLWYEFRTAFAENFRQGVLAGTLLASAGFAAGWSVLFFQLNLGHGMLMLILLAFALCALLLVPLLGFYLFAQIAVVRLPFPTILSNAILLSVSDPKRTLPALLASTLLAALPFLFPPVAPLVFFFLFSASSLFANLAVWPGIHAHVLKKAA